MTPPDSPGCSPAEQDASRDIIGSLRQTARDLEAIVRTFEHASKLESEVRIEAREAHERATHQSSSAARAAADEARERLDLICDIREQAGLERRAAKALYQEQQRLMAAMQRRERARKDALATFERQWEKDYERKLSQRRRNIELLRGWLKG